MHFNLVEVLVIVFRFRYEMIIKMYLKLRQRIY